MGRHGYQAYLAHLMTVGLSIRNHLNVEGLELLNNFSLAPASIYFPTHKGYTITYDELQRAPKDVVKKYNNYTFSLFNYYLNQENDPRGKFIFRYIPQYRITASGEKAAVIVVYPMSVHSNIDDIPVLAKSILDIKDEFDDKMIINLNEGIVPDYVPR